MILCKLRHKISKIRQKLHTAEGERAARSSVPQEGGDVRFQSDGLWGDTQGRAMDGFWLPQLCNLNIKYLK